MLLIQALLQGVWGMVLLVLQVEGAMMQLTLLH